jgi:hypothetical protein
MPFNTGPMCLERVSVKLQAKCALILLCIGSLIAGAQSPTNDQGAQGTQVRGYWTDPATGLIWAARDNGRDVSWNSGVKYCHDLRLAGYSDWRLANMAELQGLYDSSANAPGRAGPGTGRVVSWHIKGNLYLTGNQWANDQSGHSSGFHFYFDFNEGRPNNQPSGFPYSSSFMRALCVRGSQK